MGLFDSIGDWTSILNTGVNVANAVTGYNAASDAAALANKTFDTVAGSTAKQDQIAQELFDRYKTTYWPLEDAQTSQAKSWYDRYTPAIQDQQWSNYKQELDMQPQFLETEQNMLDQATMTPKEWGDMYAEKAHNDVQTSFDAMRGQTQRSLSRMGIDPTSGRSLTALNSGMDVAQSLADVGSQTAAQQQGYDTSWNRGAGALGFKMGSGVPQQTTTQNGATLSGQALSGMSSANAANQGLLNSALTSTAGGSQAYGSALSALTGTGSGSLKGTADVLKGYV